MLLNSIHPLRNLAVKKTMKIIGSYEASNLLIKQGLMLDTDKNCYVKTRKLFGFIDLSSGCSQLPKPDYILLFKTLYTKCESCTIEDFDNSSVVQVSLIYNKNRKLIIHECKSMEESIALAKQLSEKFRLRIRDKATNRRQPRWIN